MSFEEREKHKYKKSLKKNKKLITSKVDSFVSIKWNFNHIHDLIHD